jgi:hypothetical protein
MKDKPVLLTQPPEGYADWLADLIPSCVQKGKNISGKNQKDAGSRLADDPKKQDRPCRDDDYLR